ncbi:hypothetical protein ACWDUD_22595 [Rhodococcus sp. NPDC003382]
MSDANKTGDRAKPGTPAEEATGKVTTTETAAGKTRPQIKIPPKLFGGRMRTTTVAMCVTWLGLWMLYLYLNQDEEPAVPAQPGAVVISETPYVPFVAPAETPATTAETTVPQSSTPTTTTDAPTSVPAVPEPSVTTTAPTTTETPRFRLPEIPGIPGLEGGDSGNTTTANTTEPTVAPGQ